MRSRDRSRKPIWARWRLKVDGSVEVLATYRAGSEYVRKRYTYSSLEEAGADWGPSFVDVVTRSSDAGSSVGRWRP